MPLLLLLAFLATPPSGLTASSVMADSTQTYYAQKDVGALKHLLQNAATRTERLLCRYRLYPLTENERYLSDLPETLSPAASAREWALLAGLWGYRAAHASVFGAMTAGRRSMRLLKRARQEDADAPFVLLVEGQSLLFRPAIAGGSSEKALERFQQLRQVLDERPGHAVSPTEAATWTWLALREAGRTSKAEALHQQLTRDDLPPLYREFLEHPPG